MLRYDRAIKNATRNKTFRSLLLELIAKRSIIKVRVILKSGWRAKKVFNVFVTSLNAAAPAFTLRLINNLRCNKVETSRKSWRRTSRVEKGPNALRKLYKILKRGGEFDPDIIPA